MMAKLRSFVNKRFHTYLSKKYTLEGLNSSEYFRFFMRAQFHSAVYRVALISRWFSSRCRAYYVFCFLLFVAIFVEIMGPPEDSVALARVGCLLIVIALLGQYAKRANAAVIETAEQEENLYQDEITEFKNATINIEKWEIIYMLLGTLLWGFGDFYK